jgi:hypothetical protein
MGRGLSELQKAILVMAYKNHIYGTPRWIVDESPYGADLFAPQVLSEFYGWPSVCTRIRKRGPNFDRQRIGEARYNSNRAAVSRAFKRLEARGLSIRHRGLYWSGITLTEEGKIVASKLSVNKVT